MLIKTKELRDAINDKMFKVIADEKKKHGLRHFASIIGVSLATLARFVNMGNDNIDLNTFDKLCVWLEVSPKEFLN